MSLRDRLTTKITRRHLRDFLEQHRSDALTLEVGAKNRPYRDLFPNTIAGDIVAYPSLDVQFDAHHLPFADNAFGGILCTEVLEHCVEPQRVISEFWRVLESGGKLILTTRFIFPIHDAPHDYFRFTRYGLLHLCRAFSDVQVCEEAPSVETLAVLMQRLAYQADWKLPGARVALHLLARATVPTQRLLAREYGDIRRAQPEHDVLASGYYVVAVK